MRNSADKNVAEAERVSDPWIGRRDALNGSMQTLFNAVDNTERTLENRTGVICHVLQNLYLFGNEHFNYFNNGVQRESSPLEDPKQTFPRAVILRAITDQIAFDLTAIMLAYTQRQLGSGNAELISALLKADKLGQLALQPAIDSGLIEGGTTVLSYFQKSYTVRVVPYAKVALIGVPLTAVTVPRDYLAIPHEVAHYVYRHGTKLYNGPGIARYLKQETSSLSRFVQNWVEELFADIYGCLVAGPVMAIDFQDLQLDDPIEQFATALIDVEDPPPIIRPDVYTNVLTRSNNVQWKRLARPLQRRWAHYRNEYWERYKQNANRKPEAVQNLVIKTEDGPVPLTHLRKEADDQLANNKTQAVAKEQSEPAKPLDKVVALIEENILADVAVRINKGGYENWSGDTAVIDLPQSAAIDELEKALQKLYANSLVNKAVEDIDAAFPEIDCIVDISQVEIPIDPVPGSIWVAYVGRWLRRNGFAVEHEAEVLDQLGKNRLPNSSDPKTGTWGWVDLALADGWVTRGPEPNPVGD